jgi:hypothetical protein
VEDSFTDVLEIRAGRDWSELGASGAWLCVESVLHVDFKLVLGGLVPEDVGDIAGLPVVGGGRWIVPLRGDAWNTEGVLE